MITKAIIMIAMITEIELDCCHLKMGKKVHTQL